MSLENEVVHLLSKEGPLKAKDIVKKLSANGRKPVDKAQVNALLYGGLRSRVSQDKQYRWGMVDTREVKPQNTRKQEQLQNPVAKLCRYYLECLAKDQIGISVFAFSKYGNPDYTSLPGFPGWTDKSIQEIYQAEGVAASIKKTRNNPTSLTLYLGYPLLFLKRYSAKTKNHFFKVEPLLLFAYDQEAFSSGNLILVQEPPRLNPDAIGSLTGIKGSLLQQEIHLLAEELGLDNALEEQPELDELLLRFYDLRPDWGWKERMDPDQLKAWEPQPEPQEGIANKVALFTAERPRFTLGLEKELRKIGQMNESKLGETALKQWMESSLVHTKLVDTLLLEPLPMNEEQRHAILMGLTQPLTVVTGPPGTGKSQVVTNLIVNAVFQGQRVLFASRNNKAVDVVYERVNGMCSRPVMMRLGGQQGYGKLCQFINNILSSSITEHEREVYRELKESFEQLRHQRRQLAEMEQELIRLRNETNALEQETEEFRKFVSPELLEHTRMKTNPFFEQGLEMLDQLKSALQLADKTQQHFWIRLLWTFYKKKRFANVENSAQPLKKYWTLFKEEEPLWPGNDFKRLGSQVDSLKSKIKKYFALKGYLDKLKELQNQTSLFEIAKESRNVDKTVAAYSLKLWEAWLGLMSDRFTPRQRMALGDFVAALELLAAADDEGKRAEKAIWARYYQLLPQLGDALSAWSITSLSLNNRVPLESEFFDLVVVDEASQCDIASALPLLFRAKRMVVIGDNKQLHHISQLRKKEDGQLLEKHDLIQNYLSWSYSSKSLFDLAAALCPKENMVGLRDHHRSHQDIIHFSNQAFYEEKLRIATQYQNLNPPKGEAALRWINVEGQAQPATSGSFNKAEAQAIVVELKRLLANDYKGSLGVVTPFRAQKKLIQDLVNKVPELADRLALRQFLIDTAHGFQGDERDLMLFSPVVAPGIKSGSLFFLNKTPNLFNVAITRAKAALVIVGHWSACLHSEVDYLARFAKYVQAIEKREGDKIDSEDFKIKENGNSYPTVSDWEKRLGNALEKKGISLLPQYSVDQYRLDFALTVGDRKLDIEVDGEYYHKDWNGELCRRDQLRNKRLIELGWDVQRFWVYEIRDDLEGCVRQVKAWIDEM